MFLQKAEISSYRDEINVSTFHFAIEALFTLTILHIDVGILMPH